jgi:hypothetical protein
VSLVRNLTDLQYWTTQGVYDNEDFEVMKEIHDDLFLPDKKMILVPGAAKVVMLYKVLTERDPCI